MFSIMESNAASTLLRAQDIQSNTESLNVYLYGNLIRWSSTFFDQLDESHPNGIGIGIHLGYGFNQRFEAFAQYEAQTLKFKSEWDINPRATLLA